jgi:phage terminase large subunit GpA-like protein
MKLARTAVDSGHAATEVYAWARRHRSRVLVVKGGHDSMRQAISTPKAVEVKGAKSSKFGVKVWTVGSGFCKDTLYDWFRLEAPVDGETYANGYVHIPKWAGDDEVKQLTAEEKVTVRTKLGFAREEWNKVRDRNEALDCWVYAYAAAVQMGIERYGERAWSELEETLSVEAPPARSSGGRPMSPAQMEAEEAERRRASKPFNPFTAHLRPGVR